MVFEPPDTDTLLREASRGDSLARQQLFAGHRNRLRQMVAACLDRRLAARIDPSDVVQEALAEAARNLDDYLRDRPLPFYAWLRQFAWQKLVQIRRHHIDARCRSIDHERAWSLSLSDRSANGLAGLLVAGGTSPSRRLIRKELRERVQSAMDQLNPRDRELLVMRHVEEMSAAEIGALLGISAGAVRTRHVRALERLRALLDEESSEEER
jgi:RNA polymerase sigma-70 factor (ECF subfamily)